MRTHWVVALIVMSACTTQGVERARRWPQHRKEGDARFAELERRNTELEARVQKLEDWISRRLRATPPAAETSPTGVAPAAP